MGNAIDDAAERIWNYMHLGHRLKKCDAIFVLCSMDDRVASYAAELWHKGLGEWLIFSGGVAHTNDTLRPTWPESEAEHFAAIAITAGVPKDKILLEDKATNTGENVRLTHTLLQAKGLKPRSLLLVQKPFMERRAYATFKKQWPGAPVDILVTSPPIPYARYFDERNPKELVLSNLTADMLRIRDYPKRGFQIRQPIPDDVWQAYEFLLQAGHNKRHTEMKTDG